MKGKQIKKRLKEVRTYIGLFLIAASIWFEVRLILFGMLDTVWILSAAGVIFLADWLVVFLLFGRKSRGGRMLAGRILGILLTILLVLCSLGMQFLDAFLGNVTEMSVIRRDVSLVVRKDHPLESVEEITSETVMGYELAMAKESTDYMLKEMEDQVASQPQTKEYDNVNAEVSALYAGEVDVIILNESYRNLILEEKENFTEETRVIYSVSYSEQQKNISRKINVSEDPFLVMISGIDTYGEVDTVSRSDVNILAAVDPSTGRILLVSIPRDYYVPIIAGTQSIAGRSGSMDKLTHSGLFGAECTVRTVENLFDAEINYYVKVNFSGVVEIIDALGGITVQSDYAFDGFQAGSNELNGEQALSFARNRYAFEDGDRQRGKNQMRVIEGVVAKVSGLSLDYDYGALINAVSSSIEMNFSDQEVKQLIQLQVTRHPAWTVESISVTGTDGTDYSYFYGSDLYVMYPDEASVDAAKEKIREILGIEQEQEQEGQE